MRQICFYYSRTGMINKSYGTKKKRKKEVTRVMENLIEIIDIFQFSHFQAT